MRLRPLLFAGLVMTTVQVGASEEPVLRMTGSASASIDLTMTSDATARVVPGATWRASIGGRFGGFAIQSLPDLTVLVGGLRVPSIDGAGTSPVPYPLTPNYTAVPMPMTSKRYQEIATLQAGVTYRFTLFADGPTSLEVPVTGLASSIDAEPADAAVVDFDAFDLDPVSDTYGLPVGTAEHAVPIATDTLAVVAAAAAGQGSQFQFAASCIRDGATVGACDGYGFTAIGVPSVHSRIVDDHQYMPGTITAASPIAGYRTIESGITTMRRGFWFAWRTLS